jgi:hypothetical protein
MKNAIFVLSGNCRTFLSCFDSIYSHLISKLFSQDVNIYIYLYLKLTDPGPKGQCGWNFEYKDVDYNIILDKINIIKTNYPTLNIDHKIISSNEISDNDLISQVKVRNLYNGYYEQDSVLLRGLHCHFNFEKCGIYILEKETSIQCKFDYIIYVRPDLFFSESSNNIEMYNKSIITLGEGPNPINNDHIAIIPRHHLHAFFFDRMNIYRNNTQNYFITPEQVYWHTIPYEVKPIGKYFIKRS